MSKHTINIKMKACPSQVPRSIRLEGGHETPLENCSPQVVRDFAEWVKKEILKRGLPAAEPLSVLGWAEKSVVGVIDCSAELGWMGRKMEEAKGVSKDLVSSFGIYPLRMLLVGVQNEGYEYVVWDMGCVVKRGFVVSAGGIRKIQVENKVVDVFIDEGFKTRKVRDLCKSFGWHPVRGKINHPDSSIARVLEQACSNSVVWECNECGHSFAEGAAAGVDVSPNSEEQCIACPRCFASVLTGFEALTRREGRQGS
ncbi:MAG: hypothetical protein QM496_01800 [Verrucomicrobiota bacterium]